MPGQAIASHRLFYDQLHHEEVLIALYTDIALCYGACVKVNDEILVDKTRGTAFFVENFIITESLKWVSMEYVSFIGRRWYLSVMEAQFLSIVNVYIVHVCLIF